MRASVFRGIPVTLVVLFFLTSVHSQSCFDEYTKDEVAGKVKSYSGLKTAGFTMLGFGGGALASGIALMSSADWESHRTPTGAQMTTSDPQGGVGIILLVAGIPLSIAGTVLGVIGSKKKREYEQCLQVYSVDFDMNRTDMRLSLSATF